MTPTPREELIRELKEHLNQYNSLVFQEDTLKNAGLNQ